MYSIPAGRSITWYPAGLDITGGIPTSHTTTTQVTGLHNDGVTNDLAGLQAFIDAASGDTVLQLPAGKILLDGNDVPTRLMMKSNVVLRGAKAQGFPPYLPTTDATATTLVLKGGCLIFFRGGDKSSNWTPGAQSGYAITAGYTQGSTSLTCTSPSGVSTGDYICVYQDKDSTWIDDKGDTWLGEDSGTDPHVWAQYTKVTNKSGSVLTIDPPLYQVTPSPSGQSVRKQTFGITNAGIENLRIDNSVAVSIRMIWIQFSAFCWVKNVETYWGGDDGSGSPHIWTEFCYANSYEHNYCHHGASHASGRNYGIEFYHWNSRHKIENNVVRETRHSIVFEGGGSGCVILYNYCDDNWEAETDSIRLTDLLSEDQISNHGAHPYMNLWEGNCAANWYGDYTQGSSSHNTAFRNSFTGKQTDYTLTNPYNWTMVEIEQYNYYYNVIGNILGNSTMTSGTKLDNGAGGARPTIYKFGYSSVGGSYTDSASFSTAIIHGNFDFITDTIADWADSDHTLADSLYYSAKPDYFGSLTWPPYDSSSPNANGRELIPAGYRFVNDTDPSSGGGSGGTGHHGRGHKRGILRRM